MVVALAHVRVDFVLDLKATGQRTREQDASDAYRSRRSPRSPNTELRTQHAAVRSDGSEIREMENLCRGVAIQDQRVARRSVNRDTYDQAVWSGQTNDVRHFLGGQAGEREARKETKAQQIPHMRMSGQISTAGAPRLHGRNYGQAAS